MTRLLQLLVVWVGSNLISFVNELNQLRIFANIGVFPELLKKCLLIWVVESVMMVLHRLLLFAFFYDFFLRIKQLLDIIAITWIVPSHRQQLRDLR